MTSEMNDDQSRAFAFVVSLRDFYGDYNAKKEREAYVTAVLYLGATAAALTLDGRPQHHRILLAGLAAGTITTALLVWWQLHKRYFAARMVAASTTVASRWLGTPPSRQEYGNTERLHGVEWPTAVVHEYHHSCATAPFVALVGVPLALLGWGVAVVWWLCLHWR